MSGKDSMAGDARPDDNMTGAGGANSGPDNSMTGAGGTGAGAVDARAARQKRSAERRTELFERMPVHKAVLMQIMPSVASQMITLIYNLADTYFVGRLNDPAQTAAVTVAYPSFLMLTAISNLFGVGGASAVSRALGKKRTEQANRISAIAFWGGLFSGLLYSLIFLLFGRQLLSVCGATETTFPYAFQYARWTVVLGGCFVIMNTLLANLVRSEGSALVAFMGVSFGGVLNIILDPFFVLPQFLNLGAPGAGEATAISNLAASLFLLGYIVLCRDRSVLRINPGYLKHAKQHLVDILSVGFPSAVQLGLTVVAVAAQAKFVARYNTEAVAALGIVKKIDQLPLYFSTGAANGLMPLLAYNFSAGNVRRRREAFRWGTGIAVGFSCLCLITFELFAPQICGLFIREPVTLQYSAVFLRLMVLTMPIMSVCYPMIIQFQAMGRGREALICSIFRKGLLDIPFLFILDRIWPLYGCILVQLFVDTVALMIILWFRRKIERAAAQ